SSGGDITGVSEMKDELTGCYRCCEKCQTLRPAEALPPPTHIWSCLRGS
ncbi:uncharacterized, partial [Tachysurus ichikawai]